ncbi:hypothetical protein [Micromonospora sp. WMMD1155]|uniref:hypothetical protein n=1 Tax=Micromonospora sp. WMMD1155 TaxID=3016094 RepID=UPI00249C08D6|nr:hypothetical protein [Micromonospora sp. WMMD1155]WFE50925.1 hypothetical protein O7617_11575 [Micromonospora sp. WMMD1155]
MSDETPFMHLSLDDIVSEDGKLLLRRQVTEAPLPQHTYSSPDNLVYASTMWILAAASAGVVGNLTYDVVKLSYDRALAIAKKRARPKIDPTKRQLNARDLSLQELEQLLDIALKAVALYSSLRGRTGDLSRLLPRRMYQGRRNEWRVELASVDDWIVVELGGVARNENKGETVIVYTRLSEAEKLVYWNGLGLLEDTDD